MKILVIDDSLIHQKSAYQTLATHDLTVAGSHDEALELLDAQYDEEKRERLKAMYVSEGMGSWDAYLKAQSESELPYWDVVLCDLLMPAGKYAQGRQGLRYIGQEMPVGWALAIQAALVGAKYVAVVTDIDHHEHPASAMLDRIDKIFRMETASAFFTNHVHMVGIRGTEKTCSKCSGAGRVRRDSSIFEYCYHCNGEGKIHHEVGKDWGRVLQQLLNPKADS